MSRELTEVKARPVEITARIVMAYVRRNQIPTTGLRDLIAGVSNVLCKLGDTRRIKHPNLTPAVNPEQAVFAEYIVCIECGKKFASLKKHLRISHDLTLAEYRARWELSKDYPVVAGNYTATRSALAKKIGLGGSRATVNKSPARR